ncbi:VanW family protein [Paenibacillus lignilyticus]|uniref:VanW family protein n=1 Tax=Paenibacillus lignilyticus TaxID=1172615 RepID=A0ABS5CAQ5_9BACL|nr:VanW family protein [Paenibacillus lignilyticus]MBP3962895.1 VanW family protein [Paenibacillus lignilyticus]
MKPIQRSRLRLMVGTAYFTWRRYARWLFGGISFARTFSEEPLEHVVFHHATPTLRKLKDVDMWLQHNKEINLALAIKQLHGLVIAPGETMSYWKLIGRTTARKGYVPGMVLHYGKFKSGLGGGLCQLSNLIYWMTLHTPLTVMERHRHSYDVFPDANRTQPFGSGATCSYNYLDLMIQNQTTIPYQLVLELKDHVLTGEWRATDKPLHTYEIYEKEHRIEQQYWGGYVRRNVLHRRVYNQANEMVKDEYITENHALMMYAPLLTEPVSHGDKTEVTV